MNYKTILSACFIFFGAAAFAQQTDSTQDESINATDNAANATDSAAATTEDASAITDDELKKYAVTMDSVNGMKETLLDEISAMVKETEGMTNTRYNDLSKIADDPAALETAKATPEEINLLKEVQVKKEEGAAEITEVFQTMARDYIGVESYNKVKQALESDPELKSRYASIMENVEKGSSAE